jgi:predicted nucleic acid-binding protein
VDRRIIADTSGIIAFLDQDDQYHSLSVNIIKNNQIFIPATVLPEVDYLATKYHRLLGSITLRKSWFIPPASCPLPSIDHQIFS